MKATATKSWGPVQTNTFSKVYAFVVIENAMIDSRLHYLFNTFSPVHIKTFQNDRITRCNVLCWTLSACYKHTCLRFSFWCVFDPFLASTLIIITNQYIIIQSKYLKETHTHWLPLLSNCTLPLISTDFFVFNPTWLARDFKLQPIKTHNFRDGHGIREI